MTAGTEHRATFRQNPLTGLWDGGCKICDVAFSGETDQLRADAWCNGHNSAVARMTAAPVPLWFPPVGPGDAVTLSRLAYVLGIVSGEVGHDAEIVQPAAYPPLLFVWSPPSDEGWKRTRLGAVFLEKGGSFIRDSEVPAVDTVKVGRCEGCGCELDEKGDCWWCDKP